MVRRFDQRPVARDAIDRIVDVGRRAPSAGFAQGLELLVLDTPETVSVFWEIDAAMASMLMLLAAVDEGLGGWFFGITYGERELLDAFGVPARLRPIGIIGLGHRAEDEEPSGSWIKRRRRPLEEQIHRNAW